MKAVAPGAILPTPPQNGQAEMPRKRVKQAWMAMDATAERGVACQGRGV
jgi:hypothetical protein